MDESVNLFLHNSLSTGTADGVCKEKREAGRNGA
ncbi:hypothetical protein C804_02204 [Lachnospiraceae bacterium A4]|nr:hypothetical protein C804_02204 [Lachnospiraceae bacterium A4]